MSAFNLTYDEYNSLYERFLKRSPCDLFKAGGFGSLEGKSVLDLCAGTLRASKEARKLGACEVFALDASDRALPSDKAFLSGFYHTTVEKFVSSLVNLFLVRRKFDVVVCQQGVNYWFTDKTIKLLSKRMIAKDGCFIFNTFNKKPQDTPVLIKTPGDTYECYYCDDKDIIHHCQIRKNKGYPHLSSFKWITPKYYEKTLRKYFKTVDTYTESKTDIYVCRK